MSSLYLKWSSDNEKLKKLKTLGFGLPAFKSKDAYHVCKQAGSCAAICYARQGTYTWPATVKAREHNLKRARQKNFIRLALSDLDRKPSFKTIRVHDSGDFFNQTYLNCWFYIAREYPQKKFYAYTKALDLDFSNTPKNFQIIQSEGGKLDHLIDKKKSHARIFNSDEDRIAAGYVDGTINDLPAIEGQIKIGLVYHGVKNMTEKQKDVFKWI